jgi:hypothetical protein
MRFFEAAPGRARATKKIFFAGFPFFTSKWNYCRVTGPQNKIFIKNQLTLLCSASNMRVINMWVWRRHAFRSASSQTNNSQSLFVPTVIIIKK